MASTSLRISVALQCTSSKKEPFFVGLTNTFLPHQPSSRFSGLTFSSRRRGSAAPSVTSKKSNKEELAKLEQELAEALLDDELLGAFDSAALGETENEDEEDDDGVADEEDEYEVDDDNEEEEERPIKLRSWQLRRLAYALKNGRRKTSIKNLAADLCLERAVVLKLLRDPPPNLVMLSATLPDKPVSTISNPVEELVETVPSETTTDTAKPEVKEKVPVHVMQSNWSARKRLKKVQVETLEQVYKRTKRPTNAMISSIVHVTNLPRKKVVKWFEDKRAEEGVPENRLPYQRSASESVFTS
ncbi:hypothetical protein DH2020_036761 [Rehmannia glutinosa]|uniref:Homeobox domain-containing protein n=1 Tax=Rehmannia glutinosa TaxID=99300 RepID=A0ABR0V4L7_REHGL